MTRAPDATKAVGCTAGAAPDTDRTAASGAIVMARPYSPRAARLWLMASVYQGASVSVKVTVRWS